MLLSTNQKWTGVKKIQKQCSTLQIFDASNEGGLIRSQRRDCHVHCRLVREPWNLCHVPAIELWPTELLCTVEWIDRQWEHSIRTHLFRCWRNPPSDSHRSWGPYSWRCNHWQWHKWYISWEWKFTALIICWMRWKVQRDRGGEGRDGWELRGWEMWLEPYEFHG